MLDFVTLDDISPDSSQSGSPRSSIETKREDLSGGDSDDDEVPVTTSETFNIREPKDLLDMVSVCIIMSFCNLTCVSYANNLVLKCRIRNYYEPRSS